MQIFALLVGSRYFCIDNSDVGRGHTHLGQLDDEDICLYSTFEDAVNGGRSIFKDHYCNKFKVVEIITVQNGLLECAIPDVSVNYNPVMVNDNDSQLPVQSQNDKVSHYKNGKFDLIELSDGRLIQPVHAGSFFEGVDERNFTM